MGERTWSTVYFLLFKIMEKVQEHNLYLNQILNHLNVKKESIVVLIDFIAILLTPGIFLIQIIDTNNINVYLINFHSKNNIQMHFPKVGFLKFQTYLNHSLSIAKQCNKLH